MARDPSTRLSQDAVRWAAHMVRAIGDGAPSRQDKVRLLQETRTLSPDSSTMLDTALVEAIENTVAGLEEAGESINRMQELIDQVSRAPWHPATFLHSETTPGGPMAVVVSGNTRRAVAITEQTDVAALERGDDVYLDSGQAAIVGRPATQMAGCGELAEFVRLTPDGRLVLRLRGDEQVIAEPSSRLDVAALKPGARVRFDPHAHLCFETVDDTRESEFMLDEVPDVPVHRFGGQQEKLKSLRDNLTACLLDPDGARLFGIEGCSTILMHGPPGCGKTLAAQIAMAEIARRSGGAKTRFGVVKASAWESPWVGETQANVSRCFASLRQAAEDGPAALFLDEVDAVARIRGGAVGHHSDKFLATLLTEINGFQRLSLRTAVICATNRADLLDPGFRSRMGLELRIGRPNLQAAREIFAIHLSEKLPYCPNGASAADTRAEIIERATSSLYAPNSGAEIGVLKLRDGRKRTVEARELVSGRLIEQICIAAKRLAYRRHIDGGERGLRVEDMTEATTDAVARLATTLSSRNAHDYLDDLAEDEVVLAVEPVVRRVSQPQRYISVA